MCHVKFVFIYKKSNSMQKMIAYSHTFHFRHLTETNINDNISKRAVCASFTFADVLVLGFSPPLLPSFNYF